MAQPANLVLIGPTGAGKTSVGRLIAPKLGLRFVDLDAEVEASTGASIPLIFELEGEAGFRDREHRALAAACAGSGQVIATGAGAVLREDNRRLIKSAGLVVMIAATVEEQLERLGRDRNRPLLAGGERRLRLERLAEQREPIYRELADLIIDTADRSPQGTCSALLAALADRGIEFAR